MRRHKTRNEDEGIRRVAIDGHFLDEVQTRLHADPNSKSLAYVSAPVERHRLTEDEHPREPDIAIVEAFHLSRLAFESEEHRISEKIAGECPHPMQVVFSPQLSGDGQFVVSSSVG